MSEFRKSRILLRRLTGWMAPALAGLSALALISCNPQSQSSEYGRMTATPNLAHSSAFSEQRTWRRLTSKHIELVSDYPRAQALEALRVFERAKVFLNQVLPYEPPKENTPLLVFLFQDPREIRGRSSNPMAVCTFMVRSPGALHRRPMILAAGDNTQSMRMHWVHELTHYELFRRYGALPAWLDEGLASYFSSIEDLGEEVLLGTPQRLWRFVDDDRGMRTKKEWTHKRTVVPRTWLLDASDLVRTNYYQFHPSMATQKPSQSDLENEVVNYAESWLIIHMLYHGYPEYQQLMQSSVRDQPDPLKWGEEIITRLHSIPRDTLDKNLAAYATTVSSPARPIPMPSYPRSQVRVETLDPVQEIEAKSTTLAEPESMLAELNAALATQEPTVHGLRTRAWMQLRLKRESAAAHSLCSAKKLAEQQQNPKEQAELLHLGLWIDVELRRKGKALGCLHNPTPTSGTAWALALRKVAHTAPQWHAVTQVLGAYGNYEDAMASGRKALAQDPSCWACYESMAQVSFRQGDSHRAIKLQHSAIGWTPDALGDRYHNRQRSDLARYAQTAQHKKR